MKRLFAAFFRAICRPLTIEAPTLPGTGRILLACAGIATAFVPAAVMAAPLAPVRFEQSVNTVFFLPQHIAVAKGYFRDEGLDVQIRTAQGTDKAMSALLTGSADIALVGPEAAIYIYGSESPEKARIFAGLTATDGFLIVARKPAPNFDISILKGKEILGFRPGSTPDVFLEAALRKNGIEPKRDVKIVSNIAPPARAGAWITGRGDFAIFLEPEATQIEKSGNGYIVGSVGKIVGRVDYTVYVASDAFIRKNPQIIQSWTNAVKRAEQYTAQTDAKTLAQEVVQYFPGLKASDLEPAITRYKQYAIWKTSPHIDPAALADIQKLLVASGVQDPAKVVSFDAVATNAFADKAK